MLRTQLVLGVRAGCLVGALAAALVWPAAQAHQAGAASAGPRYTVVDTEGTNLIVVDNGSNTLYFHIAEPGKEVGEDLLLRGMLDLNDVGKPVLRPRKAGR